MEIIRLPKTKDTENGATIAEWLVSVGNDVKKYDELVEIETDKVAITLESTANGTVLHIAVREGTMVEVGDMIAIIGERGADFKHLLEENPNKFVRVR